MIHNGHSFVVPAIGITFDKVYAIPFYAKLNLPNERKDFRLA